jgi:hypothetical protein
MFYARGDPQKTEMCDYLNIIFNIKCTVLEIIVFSILMLHKMLVIVNK